jgi:serine/threonine protein kinase
MSAPLGVTFGKYFLLKKIATGGMGEIFLAKLKGPVGFEKLLVIKRILAHHVENREFVDMFFAEARVAAQLNHANIVQIYEMGEIDNAYFIAMEYVHGRSLRDVIDGAREHGRQTPPALAIEMISRLCEGLAYAHNAKGMGGDALAIVHRDINPHNMLVSYSGELKVIDFGIAKSEMSEHKTETGTIKGKFVYMSPEQSAADPVDKRSDIFSVGICLYETLTGFNPFAKANVVLSLDAIQRREPPPLAKHAAHLAPFDPVIRRALAKDAHDRYQDCAEFAYDLQSLLRTGAVEGYDGSLADYMHELFADDIERENRMILEMDSVDTSELERMREAGRQEHEAPRTSGVYEEHSRIPFVLALMAIVMFTTFGAFGIGKVVERRPLAPSPFGAILDPTTPAPPNPSEPSSPAQPAPNDGAEPPSSKEPTAPVERKKSSRVRPKRVSKPKPRSPVVAQPNFGSIVVSTNPALRASRGQSFKLKKSSGTFSLSGSRSPFSVTVSYRTNGNGGISYELSSDPWAIVSKDGIGVGKTPVRVSANGKAVLNLQNPKAGAALRIVLNYSGGR